MATVATTTQANPHGWPSQQFLDRDPRNGYLYMIVRNTAGDYELRRSTNSGGSWATYVTLARANLQEMGPIMFDKVGWIWWCYRVSESGFDKIFIRRIDTKNASPAWGSEYQMTSNDSNGGVAGSVWTGMDIFVHRTSGGYYKIAVAAGRTSGTKHGVMLLGGTEDPNYVNLKGNVTSLFTTNRLYLVTGSGRVTPSIDAEHNGDAKTASTPNLWVSFGRTSVNVLKCTWNGSGWSTPSAATQLRSGIAAADYLSARWDRARFCTAVINPDDTTTVRVYERNQANTATTTRDTPAHPTGVVRNVALSYDSSRGDLRVYATGTSTTVAYYIDFSRTINAWTSWASVNGTSVIGTTGDEFGVRRGTYGNSKYDAYSAHSTPSPNTVVHTPESITYTPSTPIWTTSGLPYVAGAGADVSSALTLDWVFVDPDPTDVQSAYALRRQVGAGSFQYWRASDSTWQATEQKNLTTTTQVVLPTAWALASDANYTFNVKVWDSADVPSASYSAGLTLVPSAKVNPTVTAPTVAQVLTGDQVTVTWTVSEQTAYRVVLKTSPDLITVADSGWVTSAATSYVVPYVLANGTGWQAEVTTRNNEGLASNTVTRSFSIDYLEAPAPTIAPVALPDSGIIRVTFTNPSALGSQPALASQDLRRRPRLYTAVNANTSMESGTTGWTGVGGTMTSSGTQKHDGSLALRMVPNGATAEVTVLSTAVTIDPTVPYEARAWLRTDTVNKDMIVYIRWTTSGDVLISTSPIVYTNPVASAWQYLSVVGTPPATAAKAQVAVGLFQTPAAGDAFYADEVVLVKYDPNAGVRVSQALAAGAVVDDWGPYAGTDWEYRAVAYGANATTLNGPWT